MLPSEGGASICCHQREGQVDVAIRKIGKLIQPTERYRYVAFHNVLEQFLHRVLRRNHRGRTYIESDMMTSSAPMESADQTAWGRGRVSTTMVVLARPPSHAV